ncbi:MAG: beta-ketoacyl-ACP synthase 3 [Acidobacteriota bacterium]
MRSSLRAAGFYVPIRTVSNPELAARLDVTPEWIEQQSGIVTRHYVEIGEGTADLAAAAARQALANAEITADEIDLIIVATLSPDHQFPAVAAFLQEKLATTRKIPAFDISATCAGFIYALTLADAMIRTNNYGNVLVVGAEVHSTGLDFSPRAKNISMLFGDGAGAVIVSAVEDNSSSVILSTHLGTDGNFAKDLWCEAPGAILHPRVSVEMIEEGRCFPSMNGRTVILHATRRLTETIKEALIHNSITIDQVSLLITHQANANLIRAVGKAIGIAEERVFINIDRYGNTSAASIPIALAEAIASTRIKAGEYLLLAGFGSGFTWGSCLIKY